MLSDKLRLSNFKIMNGHVIRVYDGSVTANELSKTLMANDVEIESVGKKSGSLEDYFLKMTGESGNS